MTWETETFTVPELEKILAGKKKKYIRYEEGITLYSMGKIPLRELAQEAHALIYLKHVAVINTEILDEYIERYLGIKNIRLGPTLPTFISPNILNYLVENYGIAPITTPEEDLEALLN